MSEGGVTTKLGLDLKLLFAQAVNFLIVFWILKRFVFSKIVRFMEERRRYIQEGIEQKEKAEREMERVEEVRKIKISQAKKEADEVIKKAQKVIEEKREEILNEAKRRAEEIKEKAKREAEQQKQEKIKEAREEIKRIAVLVAEKTLERGLTEKEEKELINNALDYFEKHYARNP